MHPDMPIGGRHEGRSGVIVTKADFANLTLIASPGPLRRALDAATVVVSDAAPPELVTMNSRVLLRDEETGARHLFTVVYPADADPLAGRVSVLSALGTGLLGVQPGRTIGCELDGGERRLRVEEVVHQPERSLRAHLVVRG